MDALSGAEIELAKFWNAVETDKARYIEEPALLRWLFIDRVNARNELLNMNFYGFDGDSHLEKFLNWQSRTHITKYYPEEPVRALAKLSSKRDRDCLARLGLSASDRVIDSIALYNAQDHLFQRFYPVPEAQRPRVILDFGAGYGRTANLAFADPNGVTDTLIAIDAIPASYLTQRVYYRGLGLDLSDYIDHTGGDFDVEAHASSKQVIHLPTWRLDLVPSESVDLVCCVQVLREIPGEVLLFVLDQFARVLKSRGAMYIRDHEQLHHPNQMPIDELMLAKGFIVEFRPNLRDRDEVWGLPRIWRKLDPDMYLNARDRIPSRRPPS